MPWRAPPRISTPACAFPTVGANCRGVNTTDVRVIELVVRPLLQGGIEERVDIDTVLGDLPRFRPLFVLEVNTYSCFLLLRGFQLVERTSRLANYKGFWLVTCVSRRFRLRVMRWWLCVELRVDSGA